MKKYMITSELFKGKVDVWYENNRLCYLDFTKAIGSEKVKAVLLYQIPYYIKSGHLSKPGELNSFKIMEVEG